MKTDIFWIDGMPRGRLGIASRPRGGDWLDDEIQAWRAVGVDCVISALTPYEEAELELTSEGATCREHGLRFESLAIPDRGVPRTPSSLNQLLLLVTADLDSGKSVVIHCRQGIGRAALVAASVLTAIGEDPDRAFSRVEQARGRPVPDTDEQRMWVRELAEEYTCAQPKLTKRRPAISGRGQMQNTRITCALPARRNARATDKTDLAICSKKS